MPYGTDDLLELWREIDCSWCVWSARQEGKRYAMYPRMCMTLIGLALFGIVQIGDSRTAGAIPAMSRQTGEPCSTCHDVIPKLNHTGQKFRTNGFRFPDLNERDTGRDETQRPRSNELGIDEKPELPDRSPQDLRQRGTH